MSNISAVIDYLSDTAIPTALSGLGYVEIPDSIDLGNNSELYFRNGYAVFVGEDTPNTGDVKTATDIVTLFGISLVREITSDLSDTLALREEKKLLKDHGELVWKQLQNIDPCLGNNVLDTLYTGSTPVEWIEGEGERSERYRFYVLTLSFDVKYIENP